MPRRLKFTVVTACLNAAHALPGTIESVLANDYPRLEYIVIDGGSTDGTREILSEYGTRLSRVVSEPDKGIYDAFNKGIALASGDIIGILNAGDLYAPWALASVSQAAESGPERGVFYGRMAVMDAALRRWTLYASGGGGHEALAGGMSVPHPASFVRRELYQRYGLFDEGFRVAGDWDFMLRLYMAGVKFHFINKALAAFDNAGVSSVPSKRHAAEERKIYFRHLVFFSALRKTAKRELRRLGRKFLDAAGLYRAYSRFRDGALLRVEASGSCGEERELEKMWKELSRAGE